MQRQQPAPASPQKLQTLITSPEEAVTPQKDIMGVERATSLETARQLLAPEPAIVAAAIRRNSRASSCRPAQAERRLIAATPWRNLNASSRPRQASRAIRCRCRENARDSIELGICREKPERDPIARPPGPEAQALKMRHANIQRYAQVQTGTATDAAPEGKASEPPQGGKFSGEAGPAKRQVEQRKSSGRKRRQQPRRH